MVAVEYGWHEVLVADEFQPGKTEAGIGNWVQFMQQLSKYCVHSQDDHLVKFVRCPGDIVDEVEDQLEEWPLVEWTTVEFMEAINDHQDGLADVFEVHSSVFCQNLEQHNDEFGVLIDVAVVQGLTVVRLTL